MTLRDEIENIVKCVGDRAVTDSSEDWQKDFGYAMYWEVTADQICQLVKERLEKMRDDFKDDNFIFVPLDTLITDLEENLGKDEK